MEYIIETHKLTKSFGSLCAVDQLDIQVKHGEVFGLLGPNGAGKTTSISMLCTIMKPTAGTATVNGFDIIRQPGDVRKSIGIVFQDPSVDDRLTGRENMIMHGDLYGVPKALQKTRIAELLKLVELEDRADDLLRTYSGGMRRRLEIARGLMHHPRVLFLDEPTIGLDPQTREHIWAYIKELSRAQDITIILTTHYMEEAEELCDRIAIIDYGKIVALDTPRHLKAMLNAETITITTNDPAQLMAQLGTSRLASQIVTTNNEVKVSVQNGHEILPRIMEAAVNAGIHIDSLVLHEPDMGDVFLYYTGHAIRESKTDEYHGVTAIRRRKVK